MSDDLVSRVKRLARIARRALETNKCMSIWCADPDTLEAAATALTEARAEIERLRAERGCYLDNWKEARSYLAIETSHAAQAESELSTLRAELDASNANHRQMATAMADLARKHDAIRARVREVVGPFGNLAQRYNDTVSDGWIPWIEFITNHEWPSELDCRAARQLLEEVK